MSANAWEIEPQANVGLIYTDNVELVADNEEEEFIVQLGAGFNASQQSGRLDTNINYAIQGLAYTEDDRRNEVFHQLDANATYTVSREQFFIDGDSSVSQQLIDQRQGGGGNNIATNNNRLTVFTAGVGPRLEQRIGRTLSLQANVRTEIVKELESDLNITEGDVNARQHSAAASLGNIADGRSLQWTLQYDQTRTENDNNVETRQESASLNLQYPLTRRISLIGVAGEERNNFARDPNAPEPDGSFWEAGIRWQATAQDLLELRAGERFFGETASFLWQHRARRFTSDINYTENITTTTENLLTGTGLTQISSEAAISKQLNVGISYTLPRSVISVEMFETRNEFQVSLTEDRTQGVTTGWLWNTGPRTQLDTSLTLQHAEFDDSTTETNTGIFSVQASKQYGPRTTAVLGYQHSQLDSNIIGDDYEVNTLSFTFTRTF